MIGRPWFPPFGTVVILAIAGAVVFHAMKLEPNQHVGNAIIKSTPKGYSATLAEDAPINAQRQEIDLAEAVFERPLFALTRRPYVAPKPEPETLPPEPEPELEVTVAPAAPTPPPPPQPPAVEFRGTLVDENGEWRALLSSPGGEGQWFKEGATFEDWRIEIITKSHVRFKQGDFDHRVDRMQ